MRSVRTKIPILVSNYEAGRCGVGASTAAWARPVQSRLEIWRTVSVKSMLQWRYHAVSADRAVVVYPTLGNRLGAGPILAAVGLARTRVARILHLHEFRRLQVLHRVYIHVLVAVLRPARIIVSTASEATAVARRLGRRKNCEIVVCPPANGTALPRGLAGARFADTSVRGAGTRTVLGIFGTPRNDKLAGLGFERLCEMVDGRVDMIECVGEGWERYADLLAELSGSHIRYLGYLDTEQLATTLCRWDLAFAPLADGASDGRMSLRTPLAWGIPTLTTRPARSEDFTLSVGHVAFLDTPTSGAIFADVTDRAVAAAEVSRAENSYRTRLMSLMLE